MTIQLRPRAAQEELGHNVEPRTVKPAYNNLRSANPDGSIQLILRQNLSLVLNLAGLKAISLPSSLLRPLPRIRPTSPVRNVSSSLTSRFHPIQCLAFAYTSTHHPVLSYFVEFTVFSGSCVARTDCSFNQETGVIGFISLGSIGERDNDE